MPIISHIQEILGYPTLKICYLYVFTHVFNSLKRISEIRVTAHQHCHIVEVIPSKI